MKYRELLKAKMMDTLFQYRAANLLNREARCNIAEDLLTLLPPQELMSEDEIVNKIITALQDPTACLGLSRTQVGPITVWIASALSGKISKPPEKVETEEEKAIQKIMNNLAEFGHPVDPECDLPPLAADVYGWITELYAKANSIKYCSCEMKDPANDGSGKCMNCGLKINFKPPEKVESIQNSLCDTCKLGGSNSNCKSGFRAECVSYQPICSCGKPPEKVERCEHEYILPNNGTIDAFCRKCGAWKISPPEKKEIEELEINIDWIRDNPTTNIKKAMEAINELVRAINTIRRGEK